MFSRITYRDMAALVEAKEELQKIRDSKSSSIRESAASVVAESADDTIIAKMDRTYIIDVRTPYEVKTYGMIPHALHMPLAVVGHALAQVNAHSEEDEGVDDEEFQNVFGVEKPKPATHRLVFYCAAGVRSATAAEIAESLGFSAVANYEGGFQQWSQECAKELSEEAAAGAGVVTPPPPTPREG